MPRLDDRLVAWLGITGDQPAGHADVSTMGGKGASLQRLAGLGFRVPPGFCLTTAAFRAQLAGTIGGAPVASADDMERVATALVAGPLVPEVRSALAAAVGTLVDTVGASGLPPRFAVRSSAVAEDGSAASYAGLHETELDVAPAGVEGAVRRCWASLWSPSAVAYRDRREREPEEAAMAVVVQALVPADASAVVFTCHPVTGREDQLVITSTRGLGDAMVAGTITPDTTVIHKPSRAILEFDPGEGSGGGPGNGFRGSTGPALDQAALDALVEACLQVEQRFGLPVDVEAAYAHGAWFLLQARPITTGSSTDGPVSAARATAG